MNALEKLLADALQKFLQGSDAEVEVAVNVKIIVGKCRPADDRDGEAE